MAVSTTTTTPTGWAADATYNNWLQAQQAINRPYEAYSGNMLAGFQPMQNAAIQQTGQQYGGAALQAGSNAAQNAANYQAPMVNPQNAGVTNGTVMNFDSALAGPATQGRAFNYDSALAGPAAMASAASMNRGTVRDVASRDFTGHDINQYMNPYTNTVVNNALGDLSRQNDITNNNTNARAAAAGAFGGSRQAVANTLNNENYLRESGNLSGNLRNQAFNAASGLIETDAARNLQAQTANQGMDWNVGSLNTNIADTVNRTNAAALNNMSQYNASNQQQANMATAAAHNASEARNMDALNARAQYNAGNQQQANMQTASAHNDMTARNMAAQNSAALQNSDLNLRGQLANQAAGQNATNTSLSAANALRSLGLDQQAWNSNNANALWGMGARQQVQEQAGLTNAAQQWQRQYDYPLAQAGQRSTSLGGYNSGSAVGSPYYSNTAANVLSGGLGAAQLAGYIPSAIGGVGAGYNALSGLLPSAASALPNSIYGSGAMSAADLLKDYQSTASAASAAPGIWDTVSGWFGK